MQCFCIRPAKVDDVAAMDETFREAGAAAWAHIFPNEGLAKLSPPARWAEAVASHTIESPRGFVAEADGVVVGFAVIRPSPEPNGELPTGELDSFYTRPSVWGKGVGRALMDAALDALRKQGFARVTAWTAEENFRPRAIYERAGWVLDGTSRRRSLHGVEFIELRYSIAL